VGQVSERRRRGTIEDHLLFVYPEDTPASFDVYITWKNYVPPVDRAEDAIFIYNGEEMGQGEAGFLRVIEQLRDLHAGAGVLIYPQYYAWPGYTGPIRGAPIEVMRFTDRLSEVAMEGDLTLIYSSFDHRGRLLETELVAPP
jgi:hypothetical protein